MQRGLETVILGDSKDKEGFQEGFRRVKPDFTNDFVYAHII